MQNFKNYLDEKAFLSEQCKEIDSIQWERLEISSGKLEI